MELKSRKMKWRRRVAHMEETGNACRILVKSRKGTRPLRGWRILFENTWAYHKVSRMYFL
jgi:hypothetical protein